MTGFALSNPNILPLSLSDKALLLILGFFCFSLKHYKHNQSALEQWYVVSTWQIPD